MRHKMFLVSLEIIWVAPKLNHVLENQDRSSGPVNIAIELDMANATAVGTLCDHGVKKQQFPGGSLVKGDNVKMPQILHKMNQAVMGANQT